MSVRRHVVSLLVVLFGLAAAATAQDPACGNGRIEPGEQCDDGNLAGGDGCAATCAVEQECLDPGNEFSFFVWSDSYVGGGESGVERVFTDAVNRLKYPDRVVPRFWVSTGDIPFMADGSSTLLDELNDFISDSAGGQNYPFTCDVSNGRFPYFVALGNHDVDGEGTSTPQSQYDYWSNTVGPRLSSTLVGIQNFRWGPSATHDARTTYSFDYKNAHFVVLNEFHGDPTYPTSDPVACVRSDLMQWLDEDLAQTARPLRFVFGHEPAWSFCSDLNGYGGDYCPVGHEDNLEPPYRPRPHSTTGAWDEAFGRHWGDSIEDYRCPTGSREAFWSLLGRHGVVAMFNGHTHTYSSRLVEGDGIRRNDVHAYDKGGLQFEGREGVWQIETGTTHNSAGAVYVLTTVRDDAVTFETYDQIGMTEPFKLVESWRVLPSQTPRVAIVSPAPGAIFAAGAPVPVEAQASDLDGNVAQVAFYAGSTSIGVDSTSPYSVTWTSPPPGPHVLTAIATDNSGLATTSAVVQITVNDPSDNDPPALDAIAAQTANEGSLHTFIVTASDPDGSLLTFSLVGAPEGAAIDAVTGAFAWTAAEAQGPGSYGFTVRVTDDGTPAQAADQAVTVSVQEVNEPPVLAAMPDRSVAEGAAMTALASATDPDLPANGLAYMLLEGPTGAVIGTTGDVTWTPAEADGPGSHHFTVRVTDDGSPALSATTSFTVTVGEVNKAPVLAALSNRTVTEGSTLAFPALATDADLPANTLTYGLVGAPTGATIDPATGAFAWTPALGDVGTHTFAIRVTDDGTPPLSNQKSLTVTVKARPDLTLTALSTTSTLVALGATLPASSSVKNVGASAAGAFVTHFSLSLNGVYGDSDDVGFSAVRSIASLSAGSTNTGSATLTVPVTTSLGTYVLCARADGANSVEESSEANNSRCTAGTIVVSAPDMRVAAISPLAAAVARGAKLKITSTVANDGGVTSKKCVVRFALSADPEWSGDDRLFTTQRSLTAIAPGATSTATTSPTVPTDTPPGLYHVCALADANGVLVESNEANNASCSAGRVEVR